MTLSQSAGGSATSSRRISISGCGRERRRDGGGEAVAIDRERAAGRHLVGVAAAHDQRAEPAHLLVQQADRIGLAVVGAERVGADQLGQRLGLVRGGRAHRAHLVQHDRHAAARDLPGRLGAREPAADDVDRLHSQGGQLKIRSESTVRNEADVARTLLASASAPGRAACCCSPPAPAAGDAARAGGRADAREPVAAGSRSAQRARSATASVATTARRSASVRATGRACRG